jgi:serine protease Do
MSLAPVMSSAHIADILSGAADEIVRAVRGSLVVLHNGRHGVGAGVVWESRPGDGAYILTNAHVVAHRGPVHSRPLRAAVEDGSQFPARTVAEDPEIDLALLHIDAEGLPAARPGDSRRLRVGQLVWAVGHPWGQRGVTTAGVISSLARASTHGPRGQVDVIRSDARLAPGNSGGPLVDAAGCVVGVNTMIVGGDQGIAVPAHLALEFVDTMLKGR